MKQSLKNIDFEKIAPFLFEGVIIADKEGLITGVNKAVIDYFPKLTISDLIGKPLCFLIHSKDLELFMLNKQDMRNINISIGLNQLLANFRYINKDNILIAFKNITSLQNTLNDLNEANNQIRLFHSILDKVEEGVCFIDNNQKVIFYNKKMGELDSREPSGVREELYGSVFQKANFKVDPLLNSLVKERKIIQNESFFSNSGKKYTVNKTSEPLLLGNKKIGALSIVRDLSKTETIISDMVQMKFEGNNTLAIKEEKKILSAPSLTSKNKTMLKIFNDIESASSSTTNVLIYGEKGVGKNFVSSHITNKVITKNTPFFNLNCGAIPSNLLEKTLFGDSNSKGLLELANGGTILLDEVNTIDVSLQEKLLRVLRDNKLTLGNGISEVPIQIRFISLMNEKPEVALKNNHLLEEMFYILAGVSMRVPSLRERKEDIPLLIEYFLKKQFMLNENFSYNISEEALEILLKYNFPGNVRQLEYIIEGAIALLDNSTVISTDHLPSYISKEQVTYNEVDFPRDYLPSSLSLTEQVEAFEKEIIANTLASANFNITNAAEMLGITRQSLNYKIKKYEITITRGES
ncbi:sigma 54-interacting transcriptional regulator [Psychrobacillus sp. PGGUH221]|uniref:sigma 54-interacting transcriptional regulator n=1 Tax=Psychrobacillus sp. PGGUH221 TaxID=3020058 RepID=UPI0035C7672E